VKRPLLISACLLGEKCRWDGGDNRLPEIPALAEAYELIPVCPEVLGGLPTPREPSEVRDGRVVSRAGEDVTEAFQRGAERVLALAERLDCTAALLKERSPSCGSGRIYDGTFTGTLTEGDGLAARLLREHGIRVLGESECQELL